MLCVPYISLKSTWGKSLETKWWRDNSRADEGLSPVACSGPAQRSHASTGPGEKCQLHNEQSTVFRWPLILPNAVSKQTINIVVAKVMQVGSKDGCAILRPGKVTWNVNLKVIVLFCSDLSSSRRRPSRCCCRNECALMFQVWPSLQVIHVLAAHKSAEITRQLF